MDGRSSVRTAHEFSDESATQELQAESSNLSYSPGDESDRSDGASSRLSIHLEKCSVEFAETFTTDDPLPRAPSTSPKSPNEDLDLLEFLAELTPRASPKPKVTPSLPTVPELPSEAPKTRQSHVRNRFASQKTQKRPELTPLRLPLPTTEETTTTSSQESSSPRLFVPSSPRHSTTNSTSRVGYLRGTPRSHKGATAHRRSESQGGEKSGRIETPGSERNVRPSGRRTLDKAATRRNIPRGAKEEKTTVDEVARLEEDLKELERLADEIDLITSAGPRPLPTSTSTTQDVLNPEKPPAKD